MSVSSYGFSNRYVAFIPTFSFEILFKIFIEFSDQQSSGNISVQNVAVSSVSGHFTSEDPTQCSSNFVIQNMASEGVQNVVVSSFSGHFTAEDLIQSSSSNFVIQNVASESSSARAQSNDQGSGNIVVQDVENMVAQQCCNCCRLIEVKFDVIFKELREIKSKLDCETCKNRIA